MISKLHRLLVLLVLVAGGIAMAGDALSRDRGVFSFKTYGSDQGLRNLAVTSLVQDPKGFIWLGTEDGLYRYDGQGFQRFGVKEGLPDASIRNLRLGPGGGLWVSPTTKGTGLFKDGEWRPLRDFKGLPVGVLFHDLASDGLGRTWLATEVGLFMMPPGGGFGPVDALHGAVESLWADPKGGEVYAVLKGGKLEHLMAGGQWEGRQLPAGSPKGNILAMLRDSQGRLWFRGPDWLHRVDGLQGEFHDLSRQMPAPATQGFSLVEDALGRVWTPSDAGLICFDQEGPFLVDDARGLPGRWAGQLLVDREGSLWVAAEGVSRLEGRFLWTAFTRKQGLPFDLVWSVLRSRDGTLWVGTQKGLARGASTGFAAVPETSGFSITALAEDGEGGLWAGGANDGKDAFLLHRAPGQSRFERLPMNLGSSTESAQGLEWDPAGFLWVGTANHGLFRLMHREGRWKLEPEKVPGGPADEGFIQVMAVRGTVFAAGSAGLCILENGAWRRLTTAQGLRDNNILCLVDTGEGQALITYASIHGIARLQKQGGAWTVAGHLDQPEALTADNIVSARLDGAGVLWLGTSQGVKRWDGRNLDQFLRSDGLPGDDADANALWLEPGGLWAGFSNGLARFDAKAYRGQPTPPEVHFLSVQDGAGRSLHAGEGLLAIPYRDRTMSFRFAAVGFLNESQVRLQVRLLGFEDEWRDTTVREARYTGLPPGYYQFEVRAALGPGPFGSPEVAAFHVQTPWWRTWWFLLLCTAAAAAAILAAVRWRTAILLNQTQQLEALVQERTRDLKEANSALSHMNRALEEASTVDALTGLKNRRYVAQHMPEEAARVLRAYRTATAAGNGHRQLPMGEDLVLLLVDLDHFKSINDTHGHAAGDLVLKQAADAIKKACRVVDTVARWGGEEFLVIARRSDRDNAETIARNIRDRVAAQAFDLGNGQSVGRTCSVGFAVFPLVPGAPNGFGWEEVLEVADQCLYAAKKSGRDAWVGVYSTSMDPDPELGPGSISELPAMVAEGRLELRSSFPEPQGLTWKDHVWE